MYKPAIRSPISTNIAFFALNGLILQFAARYARFTFGIKRLKLNVALSAGVVLHGIHSLVEKTV
ncbi:MAG: Co/Zn/Cd efflux system component [Spirosomataceae bacterium]|jgi:Co/Zn/Cd efflux system component